MVAGFSVLALAVSVGCSSEGDAVEITKIRSVPMEERLAAPALDTAARMGLTTAAPAPAMPPPTSDQSNAFNVARLRWEAPASWAPGEERPMRLATFIPQGASRTECVVSVLAGEAGGVAANVNRWREQMGLEALSDTEVASLPRWEMLGAAAVVVSAVGASDDDSDAPMLLGVICSLADDTLFIRMTGPQSEVEAERERFRQFCLSMYIEEGGRE